MTDQLRETLFNLLGPVTGLAVLDAYGGSGAIGIEALSRGAAAVVGVESLPAANQVIRQNLASLELSDHYRLYPIPIERWLRREVEPQPRFDLIVAGPPFAALDIGVLNQLAVLLEPAGRLVVWHSSRIEPPALQSVRLTQSRKYGDSALSFYTNSVEVK